MAQCHMLLVWILRVIHALTHPVVVFSPATQLLVVQPSLSWYMKLMPWAAKLAKWQTAVTYRKGY